MDKEQLKLELLKFCEYCLKMNKPISVQGISEAYPGVTGTSYTAHILVGDWAKEMSCSAMLGHLIPLFFDSTTIEARKKIFNLDVFVEGSGMNCYYEPSYEKLELTCS